MSEFNYLPSIDYDILIKYIKLGMWKYIPELIRSKEYERIGLDRFFIIAEDMRRRYGSYSYFNILDVGCNNGLLTACFGGLSNNVIGIDNFIINAQGKYNNITYDDKGKYKNIKFVNVSVQDFIKNNDYKWDFILLLSVMHQWEYGYAHNENTKLSDSEIHDIVNSLFDMFNIAIYYEAPFNEPGFTYDYGIDFLRKYVNNVEQYNIELVDETVASNGYLRNLMRIERKI